MQPPPPWCCLGCSCPPPWMKPGGLQRANFFLGRKAFSPSLPKQVIKMGLKGPQEVTLVLLDVSPAVAPPTPLSHSRATGCLFFWLYFCCLSHSSSRASPSTLVWSWVMVSPVLSPFPCSVTPRESAMSPQPAVTPVQALKRRRILVGFGLKTQGG